MPPTIALLIHSLDGGGAERLMSQLATRWASHYQVHLITWSAADTDRYPLPQAVKRHGLKLQYASRLPLGGWLANFKRMWRLRRQLQNIAPDFCLSFSDQMNVLALQTMRTLRQPLWIAEHSDPRRQRLSAVWEFARRRTYPHCAGCVALTADIGKFMQTWIPAERLRIIPPAIQPPPRPTDAPETGSWEPDASNADRTFLYVGRLSREKGVDLLLSAWSQIAEQLPAWQLQIAGSGPSLAELQQQASGLQRVVFLGWQDDPWPLYRRAACFLLPSRYEGFPVAMLEAMSQGQAVVAARCCSAVDDFADHRGCVLPVALESSHELAAAMLQMAADDQLRAKLGQRARQAAQEFTWEQIGPRWDAILAEGLAGRQP